MKVNPQVGMNKILRSIYLSVIMIFIPILSIEANPQEDWTYFHGPNGDNKSKETGLLKKWPKNGPELLWTASGLGKGYSSVTIANKVIYTAGSLENGINVFAFDYSGKLKWRTQNGKKWEPGQQFWAKDYDGSRATPTVNDGLVFHLGELGLLTAFKASDGTTVWRINIVDGFDGVIPRYGYSESLLIDGNNLICYPGGPKGYIVALDKKTGKTIWVNKDIKDAPGYDSPILIKDHGFRQIFKMTTLGIISANADTGELLWRIEHSNKRKLNIANPVYQDGNVCISSGYGRGTVLIKLVYEGKKVMAKKIWHNNQLDNHHGGIIYLDGYIYGTGHNRKGWFCLDFKTGDTVYRDKDGGKGSFMYADGMFYYLTEKGMMNLVKPSPKSFKIISSFQVSEGGKGYYWACPVVFDGRLYVRYDDKLFVFKIKD